MPLFSEDPKISIAVPLFLKASTGAVKWRFQYGLSRGFHTLPRLRPETPTWHFWPLFQRTSNSTVEGSLRESFWTHAQCRRGKHYAELWWLVIRWCPIYFWRIVHHTFSLLSVSAQGLESEGRRGCGRTAKKPRKAGVANLGNFLGGFQTWREGPNHINVDRIRRDMSRFSITQGSERVVKFQRWW